MDLNGDEEGEGEQLLVISRWMTLLEVPTDEGHFFHEALAKLVIQDADRPHLAPLGEAMFDLSEMVAPVRVIT